MKKNAVSPPTEIIRLRVLLRYEGRMWVAQCIDYDIASQGRDVAEAKATFISTLRAQIRLDLSLGKRPLEGILPAPDVYFSEFRRVESKEEEEVHFDESRLTGGIPPAYQIRAFEEFRIAR